MEKNHKDIAGLIFKIKRFSIHDGPGIRTTVFFKGCPLNCVWCHSPEGISPDISIWHDKNSCIACGQCVEVCPSKALKLLKTDGENIIEINRELCKLTGNCVKICPADAIRFTGSVISVSGLLSEIEKDIVFYETSGGGITLTGGEALHQPEFAIAILKECKEKNIHTAIETCLYADKEVIDAISCYSDLFIIDLKLFDPKEHLLYTGQPNEIIKKNFLRLVSTGKKIIVRIPIIPNITDKKENLYSIEEFVRGARSDIPIEYINFNTLAPNNYKKLGLPFQMEN